jgi:hypothetical protein
MGFCLPVCRTSKQAKFPAAGKSALSQAKHQAAKD